MCRSGDRCSSGVFRGGPMSATVPVIRNAGALPCSRTTTRTPSSASTSLRSLSTSRWCPVVPVLPERHPVPALIDPGPLHTRDRLLHLRRRGPGQQRPAVGPARPHDLGQLQPGGEAIGLFYLRPGITSSRSTPSRTGARPTAPQSARQRRSRASVACGSASRTLRTLRSASYRLPDEAACPVPPAHLGHYSCCPPHSELALFARLANSHTDLLEDSPACPVVGAEHRLDVLTGLLRLAGQACGHHRGAG